MKYQPSCPDLQVRLQLWQKGRNKINHNSLVVKLRAQCKSTSKNFACNQQDLRLQINLVRLKKKKRSFRTIKWKEEMRNGEEDGEDKKKEVPEVETLHLHSQCWWDTITKRSRGLPWKLERCGCYRKGPRKKQGMLLIQKHSMRLMFPVLWNALLMTNSVKEHGGPSGLVRLSPQTMLVCVGSQWGKIPAVWECRTSFSHPLSTSSTSPKTAQPTLNHLGEGKIGKWLYFKN